MIPHFTMGVQDSSAADNRDGDIHGATHGPDRPDAGLPSGRARTRGRRARGPSCASFVVLLLLVAGSGARGQPPPGEEESSSPLPAEIVGRLDQGMRQREEQLAPIMEQIRQCRVDGGDDCLIRVARRFADREPGLGLLAESLRLRGSHRWRAYAREYLRRYPRGWMARHFAVLLRQRPRVRQKSPKLAGASNGTRRRRVPSWGRVPSTSARKLVRACEGRATEG